MAGYGSSGWGASYWGETSNFVKALVSRLLMFIRAGTNARGIVTIKAVRAEAIRIAAQLIKDSFDLDTAVGVQLDRLGGLLVRPRPSGYNDDQYRTLLYVQVELILSSTGQAETLLAIVERITDDPAFEYVEVYPAGWHLGAEVATEAERTLLINSLRLAKIHGTLGWLDTIATGSDPLLVDSIANPVAGAGFVDLAPPSSDPGALPLTQGLRL